MPRQLKKRLVQGFKAVDANGDGGLTMDELLAAYPDFTEAQFLEADGDANGLIDEAELAEAREAGIIPADQG